MRDDWNDGERQSIIEVLKETGAVTVCPVHEYELDNLDQGAQEEAIEQLEGEYGREGAEDIVARVIGDLPDECPGCPGDDD